MNVETITIIALLLNLITLIIVGLQTKWTKDSLNANKQSLDANKKSFDENLKVRQLEILPRAGFFITAQHNLESWKKDLIVNSERILESISTNNASILEKISKVALKSPQGLLEKYMIDKSPSWLAAIWVTAAQYYWDAKSVERYLWSKDKPNFELATSARTRYVECIKAIEILEEYIRDLVPKVYLESPASLNDADFFSPR